MWARNEMPENWKRREALSAMQFYYLGDKNGRIQYFSQMKRADAEKVFHHRVDDQTLLYNPRDDGRVV